MGVGSKERQWMVSCMFFFPVTLQHSVPGHIFTFLWDHPWPPPKAKHNWVVVSNIFYFHPYLGKISNLTNIFQMGWNHQLDKKGLVLGLKNHL